jgi:hypothetical protein
MTAPKLDELRDFISLKNSDQQENIDLDELKLATNVAFIQPENRWISLLK